jgi:hypothetical protein
MSQETLLSRWKRAFENTIWAPIFSLIIGLGSIWGVFKSCKEDIPNILNTQQDKSVRINLVFEKDGKLIKGINITSPQYFKETKDGSFEGFVPKPLPEKIYLKYYMKPDTTAKEDEAFPIDSTNYLINIQ